MKHGEMLTPGILNRFVAENLAAKSRPFGYMFRDLQLDEKENLLENSLETVEKLRELGATMKDPGEKVIPGIPIAAILTFFGQFVDHDITLELGSREISLNHPRVLDLDEVAATIVNSRTPDLELDSVYGPDVKGVLSTSDRTNPAKMWVSQVIPDKGLPPGNDAFHDFPRNDDGSPQIGDSRNDENIVTGQLHVAFLRAHNALVDRGHNLDQTKKLLRQHYQWLVFNDFLEELADPRFVQPIKNGKSNFFNPSRNSFFMPLEFSVAAFRFGHSKVRAAYNNFNALREDVTVDLLFRPRRRLTDDWVIDWRKFLDPKDTERFSRPIDTSLTRVLTELPEAQIPGQDTEQNLAVRNLIRGFILRIPTGQAVARAMTQFGIEPLTKGEFATVTEKFPQQLQVLEKTGFLTKTPLWFYILAEASCRGKGHHLGPMGSIIVTEVLMGVLRNSTDSILKDPQWKPTLGRTRGKFDFQDLLELAGVL